MTPSNSSSFPLVILNDRQKEILKLIVEKYIIENNSISSLSLSKTDELRDWSSATIRNDMVVLEEHGFLRKEYFSSGKVPTQIGYKFYIESLMGEYVGDRTIEDKMIEIFSDRYASVDKILDKCAKLISEFLNLPTVLINNSSHENELLKRIDVVNLEKNKYIILLITSSGTVVQETILLNEREHRKADDIMAAVRLLNEKLLDCPIDLIHLKLHSVLPVIKKEVRQFEFIYETIILQMISRGLLNRPKRPPKIYNAKSLVTVPDLQRKKIDLDALFALLESESPFSPINFNYLKTGRTLFNLDESRGFTVATTTIDSNLTSHQLSIVGPIRMNYSLIKYLFDFLNEKLSI